MEMSTGVSLLSTAQSLLTGRTIAFPKGLELFKESFLHTKYGTATISNIGDLLWVHFFKTWLLRSRSKWLKQWAAFHNPNKYPQIEFGVNMSYNMRHALNTMFCLLSVSCLVGEMFCLRPCHTTAYSTIVCRRMKNSASTLVYAEYVRNKF